MRPYNSREDTILKDTAQGTTPGTIIAPVVCSAWIAPDGTFYYVKGYKHDDVAYDTLHSDPDTLVLSGYVRFSLAYYMPVRIYHVYEYSTQSQCDAIQDMMMSATEDSRLVIARILEFALSTLKGN